MAWQDLPKRQQLAVLIAAPVLVVGGLGYVTWGKLAELGPDPKLDKVPFLQRDESGSLWQQIADLEQQTEASRRYVQQNEERLARELAARQDEFAELKSKLPSEKQKEQMRRDIQQMVNEVPQEIGRVEFLSLSIGEQGGGGRQAAGSTSTVTYNLQLRADMNGLIYYINRVENDQRFMKVTNLSVRPGSVRVDPRDLRLDPELHSVSLTIVTHVYHDQT